MTEYFRVYFFEKTYGESYIITQIVYAAVVVLMMNPIRLTFEGMVKKIEEITLAVVSLFLINSYIYMVIGETQKNWLPLLLYMVIYAVFRSRYRYSTRIIMGSVFYSAAFLNIVISEPWGDLISTLGFSAYGYMGITTLVNILLFVFMGWYLKRFSTEKFSFEPEYGVSLMLIISLVAGGSQVIYDWMADDRMQDIRLYNMLISSGFLVLELLAYYMLYVISKEYTENMELLAMQQKAELDKEMYVVTKNIYHEMSAIRHEIKNHDAYMRALLKKKEYGKLEEFLNSSMSKRVELYQYVNCGNAVVNTIVNYEISRARSEGIRTESQIIIPKELPYRETELCSLLFNLLNNAIEACLSSRIKDPFLSLQMRQRGAYLFIRVQNSVDDSISEKERLKLKTTKSNQKIHGYGTKVIEMITEKYRGHVKYKIKDHVFTADIMMEVRGEYGTVKDRNL